VNGHHIAYVWAGTLIHLVAFPAATRTTHTKRDAVEEVF